MTDLGRDIIRVHGTARHAPELPPADRVPRYVAKYLERIAANFGTPADFAQRYSEPLVITPRRLFA